jgi:hypothetical protein
MLLVKLYLVIADPKNMEKKHRPVDHSKMKLGSHPPKKDDRNFQLNSYLHNETLPPVPNEWNWGEKIPSHRWGAMCNMKLENCTCAAAGHFIMTWTVNTGKLFKPSDKAILKTYSAITGYNPKTGENDTGAYAVDVLKHWRKNDIEGHKIFAFAQVNAKKHHEVKQSVYLFGGCFAGLALPKSSVKQPIWDVPEEGLTFNSWGGHAVLITGYDKEGLRAITWGKEKRMTWDFWNAYGAESYAVFSEDFIKNNENPVGIHVQTLKKDIANLKKDD